MTSQEIFDTVARHLIQQGRPAAVTLADPYSLYSPGQNNTVSCRYRTSDGLKCAVGVLIPDDVYVPNIEGGGVSSVAECIPALRWMLAYESLLRRLQEAHDGAANFAAGDTLVFITEVRAMLRRAADEFDLDASVLNEPAQAPATPALVPA